MADEHDLAADRFVGRGLERGEAVEPDQFRIDPSGRGRRRCCPSAVTTSGWGKGDRISARSSPRTHTGMSNVSTRTLAKPIAVNLAHRPVAGARLGLGPGEARADFGGQPLGDVPGIIVLERRIAQGGDLGRG